MKQETGLRSIQYSASRPTSHGREGFSIDAARLAAYRQRKAGIVGIFNDAHQRLRDANKALSVAEINARRIGGKDTEQKAFYQKTLVEAQRNYESVENEVSALGEDAQALLSIVALIEEYVTDQRWEGVVSAHPTESGEEPEGEDE